ncbi:GntR family transcriptional regulator [Actinomadura citrea]
MPSERELADEYGVAYMTVRRGNQELRERGLIVTVRLVTRVGFPSIMPSGGVRRAPFEDPMPATRRPRPSRNRQRQTRAAGRPRQAHASRTPPGAALHRVKARSVVSAGQQDFALSTSHPKLGISRYLRWINGAGRESIFGGRLALVDQFRGRYDVIGRTVRSVRQRRSGAAR